MKKCVLLALVSVLSFSVLSAFAADEWGEVIIPKGKTVHLGIGSAFTGDYANLGLDIKNGVIMALEERNTEVLGFKVETIDGDDLCDGAASVAVAEKFGSDPQMVGLIGHMCSGGSIPASKTYAKYGMSMISPSSTNATLGQGMQNVFRTCFNDAVQGKVAGEYAFNVLKAKTLVVLHDKSTYGQGIGDIVKATFEALGGKVVAFEGLTRGDKDFRPILTKIEPMNPQVVYFGGMAAEGSLVVRQMREIGMKKAAFISDDGCYSVPDFIEAAGDASDGAYISFEKPAGEQQQQVKKEWDAKFEKRFGNPPVTFAPQAYDAAVAMLTALEKVGQVQADGSLVVGKKALADTLRGLSFAGSSGEVAFTETGDVGKEAVVWQVQNKQFVIAPGQE